MMIMKSWLPRHLKLALGLWRSHARLFVAALRSGSVGCGVLFLFGLLRYEGRHFYSGGLLSPGSDVRHRGRSPSIGNIQKWRKRVIATGSGAARKGDRADP